MGWIIAVSNNKGGVGKTTLTCNLAYALALKDLRVCVVDMDSQCNATSLIARKIVIRKSLYELLASSGNVASPSDFVHSSTYPGIYCIPNVEETAALEPQMILGAPGTFTRFRSIMRDYLRATFDIVLIDTPPNLGVFVLTALYAADYVIVPVRGGSAFSLEGLLKQISLIKDIQKEANPDLRFLKLVVTQIDRRTMVSRRILGQIREAIAAEDMFQTTIPLNTAFERAELGRALALREEPSSSGSKAIKELAKELVAHLEQVAAEQQKAASGHR